MRRRPAPQSNVPKRFCESQHRSISHNHFHFYKLYTRTRYARRHLGRSSGASYRSWPARSSRSPSSGSIPNSCANGLFFPSYACCKLSAGGDIWCVDTLRGGSLEPLVNALTAAQTRKVIHAARQDLEAFYLTTKRVISPVFDTQIAAGCIGLKPQVGYAELVKTLLDVTIPKGQTRTDWSKRPLSPEQLEYAADDVLYLGELAELLTARLRELGREHWAAEDCAALENPRLYEPEPALAWERLRGIAQLDPKPRARAKVLAVWREKARARTRSAAGLDHSRSGPVRSGAGQPRFALGARRPQRHAGKFQRCLRGEPVARVARRVGRDDHRLESRPRFTPDSRTEGVGAAARQNRGLRVRRSFASARNFWPRAANSRRSPWGSATPTPSAVGGAGRSASACWRL